METTNSDIDNNNENKEIVDVIEINQQDNDDEEVVEQTTKPSLNKKQITLELGDIIEIIAPPNETLHENTFFIDYIDSKRMIIIDTANDIDNDKKIQLNFNSDGTFTDESITQIILLDRSEEKGYARQNNLLVGTWIDIEFGGEIPRIISGEITNLEEDMIEIINYPELVTFYIDFAYQGIPHDVPIEKINIRKKPASLAKVASLAMLQAQLEEGELIDESPKEGELASVEFTEIGESIINIPEGAKPDVNIREVLHEMYIDANSIIYGEKLEKITQIVEVPESEQRYGIDAQVNDMMDELLSTIPNSQRNKMVLDNIHNLIERFKELRERFSMFDTNQNAYDIKMMGVYYKPLIEHLLKMDKKLQWLIPVVSTRRKIYNVKATIETSDISIIEKQSVELRELETILSKKNKTDNDAMVYSNMYNRIQDIMTPIELPENELSCLTTMNVMSNIESVIDNLEDFKSSVVINEDIKQRKFIIQKYNLGLNKLSQELSKTGKKTFKTVEMTPSDKICIKSFLIMPEPVFRFSNIELPTTNILEKASLHRNYFLLFRLLRQNADIIPHVIDDLSKEFDYERMEKEDKINFLEGIQEFILNKDIYVDNDDKYNKFLETIIPKTRFLIRLVTKYIKDKVSFVSIVKQLEPFMIYPSDITYKQYVDINRTVRELISEIKKKYEKRYNEFALLRNTRYDVSPKLNTILRLLSEKKDFADAFFQTYSFLSKDKMDTKMTPQEILRRMYDMDNINLYTNVLTSIMLTLMTPNNLMDALSRPNIDDLTDNEKIKPMDCSRRYLAKKYNSIKALQSDNNKEDVYYDKEFDDTPYNIMKKYEKQQKEMLPEYFYDYLVENLVEKHDCPREIAKTLATTLISKKKLIGDGDYAMLEIKPTLPSDIDQTKLNEKEKEAIESEADIRKKVSYYRRLKDVWVADNEINQDAFLDTNTLFCNISANCFKNQKNNVCETTDDTNSRFKEITKKNMLQEFDKRYEITVEELEKELENNIQYHLKMLKKTELLKDIQMSKPNNLAYELGKMASSNDDLIYSPYLKLRDMIMGQDDFPKIQHDICRFVDKYCRKPMVEQLNENAHWFYCKETNTKLFPISIHELAETFVSGGDYRHKQDELTHLVGIMSDDGDSIVDKNSGFVIRKIDFSAEEGFDEAGFRITTHDILEKDLGTVVMEALGKKEKPVFENETIETIYNIMSAICKNIDIPIDNISEFILRHSNIIIEKEIYSEEMYQKKSEQQFKKTGKYFKTTYKDYRNETMITIIAGVLLIAIQTAVPSFKIKRTFPNCVRSFSGYPMSGIEDITGIQYLACVLNKMKLSQDPWLSISKYKAETLVTRIKTLLENNIMTRPEMNYLYMKKREYLLLNPELIAPDEHNISKWKHFLPPIVQYEIVKKLHNISSSFMSEFDSLIYRGSEHQTESIFVLKSKMIYFGYGIIESINDIVKTKDTILKTSGRIPFLENACCNENIDKTNPIEYFKNEDKSIDICIRGTRQIEKILKYVKNMTTADLLYHPGKTGIQYPAVQLGHFEENTYLAVIHYCNFDRNLPIPSEFKIFCNEKPQGYLSNWSLEEKIEFLKKNGKRYTIDDLYQLMKIVNQKNVVSNKTHEPFTQVDILKDILEKLDMSNSTIIAEPLRNLIYKILDKYDPLVMPDTPTKELNDLIDYLIINNLDLYKKIMRFFDDYGLNISDSQYRNIHKYLINIEIWKIDKPMNETKSYYDEGLYTITQYIINAIEMFSKVYPNALVNNDGFYKNIPKHWDLSKEHVQDVEVFVNKYYEELEEFRQDTILIRLLQEVSVRLNDLNIFVKNIPVHTEVVREYPGEEVPIVKTFYSMFNKTTILLLYKYCFYSSIYEYILCSGDLDLLRADVQEHKKNRRSKKNANMNESNLLHADLTNFNEEIAEIDSELTEYHIQMDNPETLKNRVCKLLLAFLNIEDTNKKSIDLSYDDILKRVGRSKEKEKQGIIKKLRKMTIEARSVEDMLKNYRLENWNVGQQKGLFQYDKETYNRERDELLKGLDEEVRDAGMIDNVNEELLDIYQLNALDEINQNAEDAGVGRDDYDFTDMGTGFMDGDHYGDETEDDFSED
jgi:hypothetical protein